ncbi:MAG: hypothetical protein M3Z02_03390 [Actinomycetota bacterium]|nr:hypothetical protein [Actinomycetota bacterium]
MSPYKVLCALALGILVAGATGCGSSAGKGTAAPPAASASADPTGKVKAAYDATVKAGTAKVALTANLASTGAGPQSSVQIAGEGTEDFVHHNSALTVSVPGQGSIEERVVAGKTYVHLPPALVARNGGKQWVTKSPDATSSSSVNDPTTDLALLRGVTSVKEAGKEAVRGQDGTHYTATADLGAAKAAADPGQAATFDQLQKKLGTSSVPLEAWLDGQGRLVRLRYSLPAPAGAPATNGPSSPSQAPSTGGQLQVTEEFFDYGLPVNVEPPPADQIAGQAST